MNAAPSPVLTHVLAATARGIIGRDGGMPWRLPSDLKRFRQVTMGKPVIMGRKTFQSIGKPLAGRDNIVITRDGHFSAEGVSVVTSVDAALALARSLAAQRGAEEIAVIGGGEIYAATSDRVGRIYLTMIEDSADIHGDTIYPLPEMADWREVSREKIPRGDKDSHDMTHLVLERR